jgi:predicted dehydrogenase
MADIKWGIIGCGDVTEVKSGPAFNKIESSKLVAVMRRDAEKAADYAARHQVDQWYSDADKMMDEANINSIYVATPPAFHLTYTLSALGRGLNVYVEKPVTLNAAEARKIAEQLKISHCKLTVAHYRRAVPMFLYVKELLDNHIIGDVRTVQIRMWQSIKPKLAAEVSHNWRVDPALSGGGYFHDLAPHQLDIFLFYFGEPLTYQGYAVNQSGVYSAEDNVSAQIVFKNKVVVNGSWCFNVAEGDTVDSCEIVGSSGKISFSFFGNTVNWHNDTEKQSKIFDHPLHIEEPMIAKTVAYFNGDDFNPCCIEDAIVVMDMMDAFTNPIETTFLIQPI